MLTQFLKLYAPNSLHLLFHPVDTGSPNHDLNTHLEQFGNKRISIDWGTSNKRELYTGNITRIDLESIQLMADAYSAASKAILDQLTKQNNNTKSSPFPMLRNDSTTSITRLSSFASSNKLSLPASRPTHDHLQIWSSWAYTEINQRYAQLLRDN